MTRTDIHRPSAINPVDYAFVEAFYQGSSDDWYDAYKGEHRHLNDLFGDWPSVIGVTGGNYKAKSTCDHCGARFAHGAIYRHEPTGELFVVGHQCAHNVMLPGTTNLDRQKALKAKAVKAAETARENKAARAQVLADNPGLAEAFEVDHYIVADIRRKFEGPYPNLSEKQIALVFKIAREVAERQAERAAEPTVPVVEGKGVVIEGVIVSKKWVDGFRGDETLKCLIKDDRGFKVWGTVPEAIASTYNDITKSYTTIERGDRVRLTANVEASNDDPSFGFYKRPRLAEILSDRDWSLVPKGDINDWRVVLKWIAAQQGWLTTEVLGELLDVA